jgi:hypothetical protein
MPCRYKPLDYDELEILIEDIDHLLAKRIDVSTIDDPQRRRYVQALQRGPVERLDLVRWIDRRISR